MKRKNILLTALLLSISTFSFAQLAVGGNKDAHNCMTSAGYTYSNIRKDCVKLYEEKIQLREVSLTSLSSMATLIFSNNNEQVEVFSPAYPSGIILTRTGKEGNYTWKKGDLSLTQDGGYKLMKDNRVIYTGTK